MRLGALLADPEDVADAAASGLFGIALDPPPTGGPAGGTADGTAGGTTDRTTDGSGDGAPGDTGVVAAAALAVTVPDARVLVRVVLGTEHPVTLAEEVAVLDHLSGGRVVVLLDPGRLDGAGAAEDLSLLRACWSGRPVRHEGARWRVPSGVMGTEEAPGPVSLAVTPVPAQVDVPVWLTRPVAGADLPVIATTPEEVDAIRQVQPATAELTGHLEQDRATVTAWAAAGATHLLLRVPGRAGRAAAAGVADDAFFTRYVARHLHPEVSMPAYPRIMSEADLPAVLPEPPSDEPSAASSAGSSAAPSTGSPTGSSAGSSTGLAP